MLKIVLLIGLTLLVLWYIISACRFLLSKILRIELSMAEGFVALVGLQHLVAIPILYLHASFHIYFFILASLLVVLSISYTYALYVGRAVKGWRAIPPKLTRSSLVLILLVTLIIAATQVFIRFNHDDSFNVSMIAQNIDDPALYQTEFSTGDPDFPVIPFYQLMSWELFLSAIVKATTLSPNIVAHTVVPILIIGLAYSAYRRLFYVLFSDNGLANKATIGLIFFHVFGVISRFMPGLFLLGGSWRGKSIIVALIIPLVLARLIELYEVKDKTMIRPLLILLILSLGASALNPSSIYLLLSIFIPFSIYLAFKRLPKKAIALILPALPLLLLGVFISAETRTFADTNSHIIDISLSTDLWDDVAKNYFGPNYYLLILSYATTSLFFLLNKTYKHKHILWLTVILLFTFLNPFAISLVSSQLTSSATYWRLYWIIPTGVMFASLFAVSTNKIGKSSLIAISMSAFTVFAVHPWDNFIFNENNGFSTVQNIEKIPKSVADVAKQIGSQGGGVVLAYEPGSIYARTITKDIELIWSRQLYFLGYLDPSSIEFIERQNLFYFAEAMQGWDNYKPEYYLELIEKYRVDWFWTTQDRYAELQKVISGDITKINNEVLIKLR